MGLLGDILGITGGLAYFLVSEARDKADCERMNKIQNEYYNAHIDKELECKLREEVNNPENFDGIKQEIIEFREKHKSKIYSEPRKLIAMWETFDTLTRYDCYWEHGRYGVPTSKELNFMNVRREHILTVLMYARNGKLPEAQAKDIAFDYMLKTLKRGPYEKR